MFTIELGSAEQVLDFKLKSCLHWLFLCLPEIQRFSMANLYLRSIANSQDQAG